MKLNFILFLLIVVGLELARPSWMSLEIHFPLVLLALLCSAPGVSWIRARSRVDIPFAATVGLFNFFAYVLPVYADAELYSLTNSDLSASTANLVLVSVLAMFSAWYGVLKLFPRPDSTNRVGVLPTASLLKLGLVLGYLIEFLYRNSLEAYLPGSLQHLLTALKVFSVVLTYLVLRYLREPFWWFAALVMVMAHLLWSVNSGQVGMLVWQFGAAAIVFASGSASLRPLLIFGALILGAAVGLQGAKHQYRAVVWNEASDLTELEKIDVWSDALSQQLERQDADAFFNEAAARASAIAILEHVRSLTPDQIPYREGETLKAAPVAWIPRFVWAGKPISSFGNEFGREFDLIGQDNFFTSINVPWIVDWYWNFGDVGALIGMMLSGIILGLVDRFYNGFRLSPFDLAVAVTFIWPRLIIQESNWAMCLGQLPLLIVFFALIRHFVSNEVATKFSKPLSLHG